MTKRTPTNATSLRRIGLNPWQPIHFWLLAVCLCTTLLGCDQSSTGGAGTPDAQELEQSTSQMAKLKQSASDALSKLDGQWQAKYTFTTASGKQNEIDTTLTFTRGRDGVKWAETFDTAKVRALPDDEQVRLKSIMLDSGFTDGYLYANNTHLVFDDFASFEIGTERRKEVYEKVRNNKFGLLDWLEIELYQPYLVVEVSDDKIVLQRPKRVLPKDIETNLYQGDDRDDMINGVLRVTLTRSQASLAEPQEQSPSDDARLKQAARDAYDNLSGDWRAEYVLTLTNGRQNKLETTLSFSREGFADQGDVLEWVEKYDKDALRATGSKSSVYPKSLLLRAGHADGNIYLHQTHLVFDYFVSHEASEPTRKQAYRHLRDRGQIHMLNVISALAYQPYVVVAVNQDKIVMQRPTRVFAEDFESYLYAGDSAEFAEAALQLTLTRKRQAG